MGYLEHIEGCDVWRPELDLLQQHHVVVALQQPLVLHHLQQQLLHAAHRGVQRLFSGSDMGEHCVCVLNTGSCAYCMGL